MSNTTTKSRKSKHKKKSIHTSGRERKDSDGEEKDGGSDAAPGKLASSSSLSSSSPRGRRMSADARANILFQAHLTTTRQKPPPNFSPKVIRKAALWSPRHFMEGERETFRTARPEMVRKTRSDGRRSARRDASIGVSEAVVVSKKKKSMLATVKTRAPMVEVVTKRRNKEQDLHRKAKDYDRKYVVSLACFGLPCMDG